MRIEVLRIFGHYNKYQVNFSSICMATSLKKVTENYHSARADIGARGMTRPPAGAQNKYRSRSSFSPLPWEDSYPSGLYTAIVHNGPLRTRIQDHLDEFEEFKAHLQRAQELFLGWIVTLYSLILVVAWNALESTANRLIDPCMRHVHARISWMPCPAWTKQAMSLERITSPFHRSHI